MSGMAAAAALDASLLLRRSHPILPIDAGAAVVSLFARKGEANPTPRVLVAPPPPSTQPPPRAWIRLADADHAALKAAAASSGRTCSGVLVDALDRLPSDDVLARATLAERAAGPRKKLGIRLDPERRARLDAVAARLGRSLQSLFTAALDRALAMSDQSAPGSGEFAAEGGGK